VGEARADMAYIAPTIAFAQGKGQGSKERSRPAGSCEADDDGLLGAWMS
jgi:hypothetical protein